MSTVRWGILGCGFITGQAIAPALQALGNATLHSALSRDPTKADAFCAPYGAIGSADRDRFLNDPELDAVYVATPNFRHAEDVIACAVAGKHVLCDKPLADDAVQAAAMVEACARAGVKLGVGFQLRFHPAHLEMRRRIGAGDLGTLSHAAASMCFRYPDGPSEWRKDLRQAGGGWATNDLGSHLVDLLVSLLGPVRQVHAVLSHRVYGYAGEDLGSALLEFDNGVVATWVCSTGTNAPASQLAVFGSDGYLQAEGTLGLVPGGTLTAGDGTRAQGLDYAFDHPTLYHAELNAFSEAIRHDEPYAVPGEDGLSVAKVLDAVRRSANERRAVTVT
ncbi:MAG: Gfo/Idh/MocA family oxidoreductase [Pseudomonadota bacterium]|nr:Gfo/Idh/MocA family oxidoreductase [Pseudomonadota bacterium]